MTKLQIPNSKQVPGPKLPCPSRASPQLGIWHLALLWSLGFGAWTFSSGCAARPAPAPRAFAPPAGFLAVMSAYGPEIAANEAALLGDAAPVAVTNLNGITFKHVRFAGHDLLLFPSGVSMVNAAMTTQLALERFPIRAVLFAGIAGGINPAHHIGDVVIPERWFHHSEAVYANPKPDGSGWLLPQYFTPPYTNFGFIFPDHVWAVRAGMDTPARQAHFAADPALLDAARRALPAVPPLVSRGRTNTVAVGGNGIAGPVFMDNREYRKWAFEVWRAECLDMESTAIAQVCWANRVPFLIVRSLSDLAGGQEGVNDADETEVPISRHASVVLAAVLREIPHGRP